MPWVRFEDRYPANRKVRPLSDAAFRLDVSGICWSAEQLTNGHLDDLDGIIGIKRPEKAAAELVARGRWHTPGHGCPSPKCRPIESGWLIHDYLDFNPDKDKVITEREAKAKRQARWRDRVGRGSDGKFTSRDASRDTSLDASQDASQDASRDALVTPTPPRPAPPRRAGAAGAAPASAAPPSADGGRRPAGPPPPANFAGWCGNCSDPDRRLSIDPESGNVTTQPCPRCHPSTVRAS